jgi:hypothetical protein
MMQPWRVRLLHLLLLLSIVIDLFDDVSNVYSFDFWIATTNVHSYCPF